MDTFSVLHNQIFLIVLVLASLAVILGFRKQGLKVYKSTLVIALLSPFLYGFFQQLPLWILIPGLFIVVVYLFKKLVGDEVFGNFFGAILYDVLWKLPIRILCAIGRGIKKLYKRIFHRAA